MKKNIHPEYYTSSKVTCSCDNAFEIGSTLQEIHTDVCSKCHPFYTGKQKLVDIAKRVEKFETKVSKKETVSKERKGKSIKKAALKVKRDTKVAVRKKPDVKKLGSKKIKTESKSQKPKVENENPKKTEENKDS